MSDDEAKPIGGTGTGGLTLEPPGGQVEDVGDIGFAPDLMGSAEGAPLPAGPAAAPGASGAERYPRALAALAVLLGDVDELALLGGAAADQEHLGVDLGPPPGLDEGPASDAPLPDRLDVGPAITWPTPEVRRPPPPAPVVDDAGEEDGEGGRMEDLVEMVLVGGDDGEVPSVHLMFKQDTFDGMYLKLERSPDGLFARFQVKDASTRRAVAGHVDMLLSRLRDKGMRIAGHEIVITD
jgi:hypothetical protein